MRFASLDIEAFTATGERIPMMTQYDGSLAEAMDAFHCYHPNAAVYRLVMVPARIQREPVTPHHAAI